MHVDVSPRHFDLVPGLAQPIAVTISNTGDVIGGYAVRVLGADPSWVSMDDAEVSLFPGESRTVLVTVEVPLGMSAGERRVSVQVRELTPPHESVVEDVVLSVPERPAVLVRCDPMAVTAGRRARLSVVVANDGNTVLDGRLHGQDPEDRVHFVFTPPTVTLSPGEHAMVDVRASARRPFTGNPVVRPLELFVLDPTQSAALDRASAQPAAPAADAPADPADRLQVKMARRSTPRARVGDDVTPHAQATFVQRAALSRGPIGLVGLLVAVTVFAIVITVALSRLVTQSAEDRDLALQVAAASGARQAGGTSGMAGAVSLLTSGAPVAGVEVSVFAADDTEAPLLTAATADDGTWGVGDLPAGDYKVSFRGAGFVQLWFPQAVDAADAEAVTLESGARREGLDVTLGGVPATVSGTVAGLDVSNATLTLKRPLDLLGGAAGPSGTPPAQTVGSVGAPSPAAVAAQGATVKSVPIGSDGTFELTDVPSPSVYDLIVEKPGYATSTQRIDVTAGEDRDDVEITLRQGDGVITGTVASAGQPLEGATVTASAGQTSVTTMSLTGDEAGAFAVRGLPTPASFTLVVSLDGYASQTLTIGLGDGQALDGVDVVLDRSSGSLTGSVGLRDPGSSLASTAAGVIVTVTDGTQTVQTATSVPDDGEDGADADGTARGSWKVTGLPVPGSYTITFSRDDLAPQTVAVTVSGDGVVTGEGGVVDDRGRVAVDLSRSSATIAGVVSQRTGPARNAPKERVGETEVRLVSNEATFSVVSASVPAGSVGAYRFDSVPPGTYTLQTSRNGTTPVSQTVTVVAGDDDLSRDLVLDQPAAVDGVVRGAGTGWVVQLYRSSEYPGTPYRTTTTKAGGVFSFTDVDAPQSYVAVVRRTAGGAARASTTFTVDRSQTKSVELEVSSG
ncbi:carboxypeptidase regulatory-like domain-containing protein [Nocardioides litoris]|uniref:carboxypeptidase regulatory-like domain-containing protein n=1 Tax=Nocardioides litoris TaxID=1926648 RepID=UPI00112104F7|nr:carboxypeptidase regulatory-like domain-containing protein [Nocardioides litoris]